MSEGTAKIEYDPSLDVVFIALGGVPMDTRDQIRAHFSNVHRFWQENCRKPVYFVVDYDGFTMNIADLDFYAQQVKRVSEACKAMTVIRHGGDALSRTGNRLIAMKLHTPSNIYATRADALDVVRGLRTGKIALATT